MTLSQMFSQSSTEVTSKSEQKLSELPQTEFGVSLQNGDHWMEHIGIIEIYM